MGKKNRQQAHAIRGLKKYISSSKRREKFRLRKAGYQRHQLNMKIKAESEGRNYIVKTKSAFKHERVLPPKPEYPINIKYLLTIPELFSRNQFNNQDIGHLYIPKCFSLIDNYEESFDFLKCLFVALHRRKTDELILDYSRCERIDVDSSICMDVMLAEFISHFNKCRKLGYKDIFSKGISPINLNKEHIINVLFSIGAYRNLRGFTIKSPKFEALPVLINDNNNPEVWGKSEVDLTKIVEYIKVCLNKLNRELTVDSEREFYNVIGEVMSNSLEHGTMRHSFSIGFFEETHNADEHFGIFNVSLWGQIPRLQAKTLV